jgi:CheY-like chemotaxis protein
VNTPAAEKFSGFALGCSFLNLARLLAVPPARYETILVVENEEDDALLLRKMFEKARLINPIQVVGSAEEAISYLKGEGLYKDRNTYPYPVLALLDVHLSGRSGYEIIDWIRQDLGDVDLGLVVLTGSDMGLVRELYRRGADSFLVKPLRFEDFQNMVKGLRGVTLDQNEHGYFLRHAAGWPRKI